MKKWWAFFGFLFLTIGTQAQDQLLQVAKQYLLSKDYEKAAATYEQLVAYNPNDSDILDAYIQALIGKKDFKTAEKFIKSQLKKKKNNSYLFLLAKVYTAQGEQKKAASISNDIIDKVSALPQDIKETALVFEQQQQFSDAIKVLEKGRKLHPDNPNIFAEELAILYNKLGNTQKATESLLNVYISLPEKAEDVKSTLLRILQQPANLLQFQQLIENRSKNEPDVLAYIDLMSWIFIQQKNYSGAFAQIRKIDIQLNEQGRRVLGFARTALRENELGTALQAYDDVITRGTDLPFYQTARNEKLICLKRQLEKNAQYTAQDVQKVTQAYADFITAYPSFTSRETMRDYADIEARFAHRIDSAIALLQQVIQSPQADRLLKGRCKLDMGDYELMRNEIWESTLLYSQVDKDFKQDMLGEEARFRNAKLSYYTGDFEWAQAQLDVLKASTSELIANDALFLSVLITENNPIADSNTTPLLMFAKADLLSYQQKFDQANSILDSIQNLFPKHPLADNILWQKSRMANAKQDYSEAAMYLQKIVSDYGDDVLADDALYHLAYINEEYFQNKDEAKRLYQQIITQYPGSTYINQARKNFRRLRGDKPDVEESVQ